MDDLVERLHRAQAEAARLQSWSSRIAAQVAVTEQESAALFEGLAETVPHQAEGLRRQAAAARSFAATERITAGGGRSTSEGPG